MDEVLQYILNLLRTDFDLSALIGASTEDDRIYAWPGTTNIIYNSTKPAAIIYKTSISPLANEFSFPSQRGDTTIFFHVAALNKTVCGQVEEAIISLFNLCPPFNTTNWRIGTIISQGSDDELEEGSATFPIIIRNVRLKLRNVFKRVS